PPIQGLGNAGGFKFQTEQRGNVDYQSLQEATDRMIAEANKDPKLQGLFTLYRANTPQLYIDIDRVKCESLKVPVGEVFSTLQANLGGQYINNFVLFGRTWQVNIQADQKYRDQAEKVRMLKV